MIGILDHPLIPRSKRVAGEIVAWLAARGEAVWQGSNWAEGEFEQRVGDLSLVIVLGGDGSILRAARIAAPHGVPLLNVNLGSLGFLSAVQPEGWPEALAQTLAGNYRLEARMMLHVVARRGDTIVADQLALNEAVIGRGAQARVVRTRLAIDDHDVGLYTVDGIIVATPTGSTAYAMAAGGPVLAPDLRNMIVVPVAPHLCFDRSLVVNEDAQIQLVVSTDHESNLTVDGQETFHLENGDQISVTRAPCSAQFVRTDGRGEFYRRLRRAFAWTDK